MAVVEGMREEEESIRQNKSAYEINVVVASLTLLKQQN